MNRLTYANERKMLIDKLKLNLAKAQLHSNWFAVIDFWFKRFDGYVIDYTANRRDEFLLLESLVAITTGDNHLSDKQLAKHLSSSYEGLYWHASCYSNDNQLIEWSSIEEPYCSFKGKHEKLILDQLVLSDPHAKADDVQKWLLNQLDTIGLKQ